MSNYTCEVTSGIDDNQCVVRVGGLTDVLLMKFSEVEKSGTTITDNEITAFTLNGSAYLFELMPELSSATYPPNRTPESGSVTYPIGLNMVINQDTKETREILDGIARNSWVAFAKKSNGVWIALGLNVGLWVGADGEGGTGVARTDRNGYTVVLSAVEPYMIPDVDSTVIDAVMPSS